jgi:SAM-dependent methyltransferase
MNGDYRQSQAFFESRYQAADDPWGFATSAYEQDRYHATLSALSKTRYRRTYEPGCSVGVLTAALAQRSDEVVACDISPTAVMKAQARCAACDNVTIDVQDAAKVAAIGQFDLIVFSELGYYFSVKSLHALAGELLTRLRADGEFIAVHWLGNSGDHLLTGDLVHEVLASSLGLEPIVHSRHAGFRIDSWRQQ